jgi:hypothetical protein
MSRANAAQPCDFAMGVQEVTPTITGGASTWAEPLAAGVGAGAEGDVNPLDGAITSFEGAALLGEAATVDADAASDAAGALASGCGAGARLHAAIDTSASVTAAERP